MSRSLDWGRSDGSAVVLTSNAGVSGVSGNSSLGMESVTSGDSGAVDIGNGSSASGSGGSISISAGSRDGVRGAFSPAEESSATSVGSASVIAGSSGVSTATSSCSDVVLTRNLVFYANVAGCAMNVVCTFLW